MTYCKVVGTKAEMLEEQMQEKVTAFVKHSLKTQQSYYRQLEDHKDSFETFELVNKRVIPASAPIYI